MVLGIVAVVSFAGGGGDGGQQVDTADGTTQTTEAAEAVLFGDTPCPPAAGAEEQTQEFEAPFERCIEDGKDYAAVVTTDVGEFTIDLLEDDAPGTTNNFVSLARHKFYEGVVFHRVLKGFVVQGGDPEGSGSGGPGYVFADELPEAGQYEIGSVAMANSGPNTNGSQFFVVTGERGAQLPPNYSLFGKVTSGLEVVQAIEADGTDEDGQPPAKTHRITSVRITEA